MSDTPEPTFSPGNVVRLKSGGPKMSVRVVEPIYGKANAVTVRCDWFAGSKKESGGFSPEQLVHVTETSNAGE